MPSRVRRGISLAVNGTNSQRTLTRNLRPRACGRSSEYWQRIRGDCSARRRSATTFAEGHKHQAAARSIVHLTILEALLRFIPSNSFRARIADEMNFSSLLWARKTKDRALPLPPIGFADSSSRRYRKTALYSEQNGRAECFVRSCSSVEEVTVLPHSDPIVRTEARRYFC